MLSRSCFRIASQLVILAGLAESAPQSLREAANTSGLLIGTAVRPGFLPEAACSTTLAREFNMVEPEDAMKWWVIRPTADTFDLAKGTNS